MYHALSFQCAYLTVAIFTVVIAFKFLIHFETANFSFICCKIDDDYDILMVVSLSTSAGLSWSLFVVKCLKNSVLSASLSIKKIKN